MAINKLIILFLTGLFLLSANLVPSFAQELRVRTQTPEFTDYEWKNEKLKISPPEYLMVPFLNGEAQFRILEQVIVPVQADSSLFHYVNHAEDYLIQQRDTPLIETGNPGYVRGAVRIPLTIHVTRQNETKSTTFQVAERIRIRVFDGDTRSELRKTPATSLLDVDNPLSGNTWYKIPIPDDDIYVINRDYLENLGIDVSGIDPRNIQIWTTPGYELPHRNSDPRPTLSQIGIIVEGEENGSFDSQDRILFFANGPNRVIYNQQAQQFEHRLHPFTHKNYVFLTVGPDPGIRLTPQSPAGSPSRDVTHFRDFRWLEEDLEKSEARIKSGTQWLGQSFDPFSASQTIFTDTLAGFQNGSDIEVWLSMAARSTEPSTFSFTVNGSTSLPDLAVSPITSLTRSTGISARINELRSTLTGFSLNNDILTINTTFQNSSNQSRGWVEWIRIRADREFRALNNRLLFHPPDDVDGSSIRYQLTGFSEKPIAFDISNVVQPVQLSVSEIGNRYAITHSSESGDRFIARSSFRRPPPGKTIDNQDIRNPGIYPDYVIITISEFLEEAERLASYRQERDGLTPIIVTQNQIFNEFNGGVPDFVALRDYLKFLYDRGAQAGQKQPEYLLFFGVTTYDYKGVIRNPNIPNHVFTFQSEESIHRTDSYGSDDFFGFMGDDEGLWPRNATDNNPINYLDIGIGRLPATTLNEARLLVDKIKSYEDPRNRGDWQSLFTFVADDDIAGSSNDRDLHVLNADGTADVIDQDATGIRVEKIYQISYPAENTSAGQRVPQATQALIDRLNDGSLIFNFSGHGAEQFLTDQRLFTEDDINRLTNQNRLSIMVTATCSFGRFDDLENNSGAEKMLLHPDGGLIAALTTTRVVFTSPNPNILNFGLNIALTRQMTERDEDGRPQRLGDIFRNTKLTPVGSDFNARKFILLGDPAMRLGLPDAQIEITEINGTEIRPDTLFDLRALDLVSIGGYVTNPDGSPNTTFNGEANVRVFDAERMVRYPAKDWVLDQNCYLENCGYFVQTDALFNGRVSVVNGHFQSEFMIPKDVSYSERPGRIQVYGHEQVQDAVGSISSFRIRGRNPDAEDDQRGPDIEIYMNDELFNDGGIVNDSPEMIVLLSDDSGINTTGAGVGHEIIAILEHQEESGNRKIINLNDFYQSDLDNFRSGRIIYPLNKLKQGRYRVTIRAWDVFNNLGESMINFEVLDSADLQIKNVFNYPNPMHNFTRFAFEHNQPGNPLDIIIRIYTLSGVPVKTIRSEEHLSIGNTVMIPWDGRDDDFDRIATGTYLYHLQVRAETNQGRQTKDKIERLVILR